MALNSLSVLMCLRNYSLTHSRLNGNGASQTRAQLHLWGQLNIYHCAKFQPSSSIGLENKIGYPKFGLGRHAFSGSPKAENFVVESQFSFTSTFVQNQPFSSIGFGDREFPEFGLGASCPLGEDLKEKTSSLYPSLALVDVYQLAKFQHPSLRSVGSSSEPENPVGIRNVRPQTSRRIPVVHGRISTGFAPSPSDRAVIQLTSDIFVFRDYSL